MGDWVGLGYGGSLVQEPGEAGEWRDGMNGDLAWTGSGAKSKARSRVLCDGTKDSGDLGCVLCFGARRGLDAADAAGSMVRERVGGEVVEGVWTTRATAGVAQAESDRSGGGSRYARGCCVV
jgi:hypothetical protein